MPSYSERRVSNTGTFNLEIVKGTDFLLIARVQEKNQTFGSSGYTPVDLTGWTWIGQIRSAKEQTLVTTFTITIANQATDTGVFYCALTNATTAAVTPTSGVYDVIATNASSEKKQILRGTVKFSESVSV
ncbi:MAG: hypothetical protein GY887_15915 [Halieaceae bacterium]|jgi:hypothetical protein|nr:hypothetical protein [Halieaceae bacterium]